MKLPIASWDNRRRVHNLDRAPWAAALRPHYALCKPAFWPHPLAPCYYRVRSESCCDSFRSCSGNPAAREICGAALQYSTATF